MREPTNRPGAAMLVAVSALVFAMAGSAWALPGRGKVEADDLAKGSVTEQAIATSAVGRAEIATSAVGRAEIAASAVREAELKSGSVGNGELKAVNQRTNTVRVASGSFGETTAQCRAAAKEQMLSGGADVDAGPDALTPLVSNGPSGPSTWTARIQNMSGQEVGLTAVAFCLER